MATTFLEPGGDADFLVGTTNGFWGAKTSTPSIVTDFVHGNHINSIKYRPSFSDEVAGKSGVLADAGSRISIYIYLVARPASATAYLWRITNGGATDIVTLRITSGGILRLYTGGGVQIGTNGATLSTGIWYRISLAYTVTSTTVNRFELFVNGVSSISVTNATIDSTGTGTFKVGNAAADSTLDFRSSDHYIDDSSSLTDTGNIWVTAKRPFANGTTNGFTTQIGAGGSGYGSGHSPQVNERPLSTTNGWSMVGAGATVYEVYNSEAANVGDIDITRATIVDVVGWMSASSLVGETAQLTVMGNGYAKSLTSTPTLFTAATTNVIYPAGAAGYNIGILTDTSFTTVSLYECGVLVAFIPAVVVVTGPFPTHFNLDGGGGVTGGGGNASP